MDGLYTVGPRTTLTTLKGPKVTVIPPFTIPRQAISLPQGTDYFSTFQGQWCSANGHRKDLNFLLV